LTDIYSAGEDPIPGVDGEFLVRKVSSSKKKPGSVVYRKTLEDAAKEIVDTVQDGDVILCMGAGSITKLPDLLVRLLDGKGSKKDV